MFKIKLILTHILVVYKIGITAGVTCIREMAAMFGPTRITYKDSCLSDNAVL